MEDEPIKTSNAIARRLNVGAVDLARGRVHQPPASIVLFESFEPLGVPFHQRSSSSTTSRSSSSNPSEV
eukprot:scaffold22680_cov107-Cylindrotheca_fusiformis.AAC.8